MDRRCYIRSFGRGIEAFVRAVRSHRGDREQLRWAPDVSFRWALRFDALALDSDPLTWERQETHPILVQAIREPR